ncbi:MAG: hypothetical protein AB1512_32445 [Thermodesulfobacteriota bacterium]
MKAFRQVSCLVVLALLVMAGGCGKKGPPFLPEKSFHVQVSGLKAEWDGNYFLLSGRLSQPERARGNVSGSRVYFGRYPLADPPCETCPVEFHGYHGFGLEVIQGDEFFCRVPGKMKGHVYFFKVHLISMEGTLGPASNQVRIAVKP